MLGNQVLVQSTGNSDSIKFTIVSQIGMPAVSRKCQTVKESNEIYIQQMKINF